MWPWSTIAKLRADLAEARDDAERFANRAGRANTEAEQYRQRWATLNESYETLMGLHKKAQVHFDQQNDTVARQHQQIEDRNAEYQILMRRYSEMVAERNSLAAQLAEAQKNDARDPKTGRFVKSQERPGVTAMGSSTGEVGH